MTSTAIKPLINSPFKPLKTSSTPPPLICMAARANGAVQKPLSVQKTLFSPACNEDLEAVSYLALLPDPFDQLPTNSFCFSPRKTDKELHHAREESSASGSKCVTTYLGSPTKNTESVHASNPQTPQQKRKRIFTANSPSTPLLTPDSIKKFGKIASPLWTHIADNFSKMARNSKEKMNLKKTIGKLEKKPVHTWEVGSPTTSTAIKTKPDKEGRLKHKGRYYRLHEPEVDAQQPETKKTNRVIPVIGPFFIRQPGPMSQQMFTEYQASPTSEPFKQFLIQESQKLFATLHPRSTQTLETTGLDFVEA
ncbi:MAG TPA: hypothetical protein VGO47_03835 [Chlamydiales bacterium]|jgi:hypothetical protein|nr:hypothetical protein [Chlamydiales bacterium]